MVFLTRNILILNALLAVGCGAPSKSADDVSAIFSESSSLQAKTRAVCEFLQSRNEPPMLKDANMIFETCSGGGRDAVDFLSAEEFQFLSIDSERTGNQNISAVGDSFVRLQTRAEFWLGHPILSVVNTALSRANDSSKSAFNSNNEPEEDASSDDPKIEVLEEPSFDPETLEFKVKVEFSSMQTDNGLSRLQNKFAAHGALVSNQFAVLSLETFEDAVPKDSYIHRGRLIFALIPHENDILLAGTSDIYLHDFGVRKTSEDEFFKSVSKIFEEIVEFTKKGS